jgi:hypothetical protein
MIEESYVSFDTARMLKEAGFRELTKTHYSNSGQIWETAMPADYNDDFNCNTCNRPTQALAARWLREKHKIHVGADMAYSKLVAEKWIYQIRFTDSIGNPYKCVGWFNNYEEALEAGLQEAIKLIKK